MESITYHSPLIVIVGQTASGKTALSLQLAQQFNGEIIAADSRTVYKDMDIGTAKPTLQEQASVPHHLLSIVFPNEPFTVADFQARAQDAIADITSRGKIPFMVGGSGLYVDSVIYNFSFRAPPHTYERAHLNTLPLEQLQSLLAEKGIALPENKNNPRHLIRAIETGGKKPTRSNLRPNTLLIGMMKEREVLEQRIRSRVEKMVEDGFVHEVRTLFGKYGANTPALQAPGYRAFYRYLVGEVSLEEAKQQFVQSDLQYAKRQKTWFKRNPDIHWISNMDEAVDLITTFLNK